MVYGEAAINEAVCTPLAHRNIKIPQSVGFRNLGKYAINLVSGIAKNGVPIFSPTGFANYKDAFDNAKEIENLDECLGNVSPKGYYFYRSMSPCLTTDQFNGRRLCRGKCKPHTQMRRYAERNLKALGILKDGRVVLAPNKRFNTPWGSVGVDVCNSSTVDISNEKLFEEEGEGRYQLAVYIASFHFPYISGCFGGGNYPSEKPTCTSHPIAKKYV